MPQETSVYPHCPPDRIGGYHRQEAVWCAAKCNTRYITHLRASRPALP